MPKRTGITTREGTYIIPEGSPLQKLIQFSLEEKWVSPQFQAAILNEQRRLLQENPTLYPLRKRILKEGKPSSS